MTQLTSRLGRCFAFRVMVFALFLGSWPITEAAAQSSPHEVRVGIFVTSVSAIDPRDGSFRIAGYIWFVDPTGTFDPQKDMEIIARSATIEVFVTDDLPEGATYTAVSFNAVVDHAFDIKDYPFDEQTLVLRIESARSTATLSFVPDQENSSIADFVSAPGWRIDALKLNTTLQTYDLNFGYRGLQPTFSRLAVVIDIRRHLSPFLFEKFTGFLVAFAITTLVLFVPIQEFGTRVGMTTGSVFAAVFNRYRMEDAIGFGAVFGVVDQVSLLTFSAILQTLVLTLVTHHLCFTRGPYFAGAVNKRVGAAIIAVHLILVFTAFSVAMP